jgi:SAM-dependent methyltransferase
MLRDLRKLVRRGMEATGLIGPYYRMVERRVARATFEVFDDGRPMPPPDLAMAVAGTAGQKWFSEQGRADAGKFTRLAAAHGLAVDRPLDVLDFGCGCGRIARWMAPDIVAAGGTFTGSDLNPKLVAWCAANLPGAYFANGLRPPLTLASASIDLVYAHSVLTHLTEVTALAWLAEIRRALRPGGLALLTFMDDRYAERWGPPDVLPKLRAEGFTVLNNALEGSNYMSAWMTPAWFNRTAEPAFEALAFVPSGAEIPEQAIAVLRARG